MSRYQTSIYLILTVFGGLLSCNVKCYPSEDNVAKLNIPYSIDNSILTKDEISYRVNDAIRNNKIQKRNVLFPSVQIPSGDALSNSTVSEKPSVKKELKLTLHTTEATNDAGNLTISNKTSTTPHIVTVDSSNNASSTKPPSSSTTLVLNAINVTTPANNVTQPITEKAETSDGAKKRGLLVFGSLGLFSAAYLTYKIYKRRKQQGNNDLSFYPNNNEQFKYGVLMSNDNDDNLELSNIPQTMDSDDEEVEIFDLENRKFLENEGKSVDHHTSRNQDVEILDLNLPGVGNEGEGISGSSVDDNLLNFDDSRETIENVMPSRQTNGSFKSKNQDDFFDIL